MLEVTGSLQQSFLKCICYLNTSNFVKNTPLRVVFSTLLSMFGYPNETRSLMFDTLNNCRSNKDLKKGLIGELCATTVIALL